MPKYLDEKGALLKDGYNKIVAELGMAEYTKCIGYNCRSMVTFTAIAGNGLEVKALMQQVSGLNRYIQNIEFNNMII